MTGAARVVGWWALLGLIALASLASAVDRLAGQGVLLDVPAPLASGGQALMARAAVAARSGDVAAARMLSRAALARRPVDAAALRTAGLAAIAAGEPEAGDTLMRLAGAGGWRDMPTQLYWAEVALAGGSLDVAAERLDGAIRTGDASAYARILPLLRRLERTPAGRSALVARWREPNGWAAAYLADVGGLDDAGLEMRAMTTLAARRYLDRAGLDSIAWALVPRRPDLAYLLAGRRGGQWIAPFEPAGEGRPGPFAWVLPPSSGLDAAVASHRRGQALHIVANGPALIPVASQLTRLPPGLTRLTATVEGARTSLPLIATLACATGGGTAVADWQSDANGRFVAMLPVPAGCPTQSLTLSVAGEEARRGADLWVSAVTAAPMARAATRAP